MTHLLVRWLYLTGMYSGIRGVVNRFRSRLHRLDRRVQRMNGRHASSPELGDLVFRVHARARPLAKLENVRFGVLSIRLAQSPIHPLAYRYLCRTSHFGCGHVEIAFYECEGEVTFYGIRNIARANAERLGLSHWAHALQMFRRNENPRLLGTTTALLSRCGLTSRHAEAGECVQLAVDDRLLPRGKHERVRTSLLRKYEKLHIMMERQDRPAAR